MMFPQVVFCTSEVLFHVCLSADDQSGHLVILNSRTERPAPSNLGGAYDMVVPVNVVSPSPQHLD